MADESIVYKTLKKLHPQAHWVRLEAWSAVGCPDVNGCLGGVDIWVESKEVYLSSDRNLDDSLDAIVKAGNTRKSQMAWLTLRALAGGNVYVGFMLNGKLIMLNGRLSVRLKRGMKLREVLSHAIDPVTIFNKTGVGLLNAD